MIKNYFKIAWRNLLNHKFYSAISISGLTIGLSVGILILIWVQDELSFNNQINQENSIYRVNSKLGTDENTQAWPVSPGPVAAFAISDIPKVKSAVRVLLNYHYSLFTYEDEVYEYENSQYIDPEFFNMFKVKFLRGNKENPFPDNQSIVITASIAKKIFGNQDPIGKTITAERKHAFTVTAVVKDLPENSSLNIDIFFPISIKENEYTGTGYWKSLDSDWGNFRYVTYLELAEKTSAEEIAFQLSEINRKNDPNAITDQTADVYALQNISTLNLYNADGSPALIQTVQIFSIVALLILLIASINYINLSTARSMQKAREVGIRKVIGAEKKQLFFQFIIESVLYFFIALVLACALTYLLMPYFNAISGKEISFDLLDARILKTIGLTVIGTLLASSIYPAVLLSSFKPLQAIKGKILPGVGNVVFRKVLVTLQFTFSVILIIGTLVIGKQLTYINSLDPGYNREQVLTFGMRDGMNKHLEAVKAEISKEPGIIDFAVLRSPFLNNGNSTGDTEWDGKMENSDFIIKQFGTDEKFIPLMNIEFVEGENFKGIKSDTTRYILNETAVREMGIKDPIGKRFALHDVEGTIVGVVKDFNFNSLKQKVMLSVFFYNPEGYNFYIKVNGKQSKKAILSLETIWKRYNAGFPFNYTFLDTDYEVMYRSDRRTESLFTIFSCIAIFVSCLGLFGLVTHTAQQKKKEVGIRKVLGASVFQITYLISWDFLKLILLATLIASPIAWYFMREWLQDFAYRIEIEWWMFFVAGLIAILIALITVSFQAIKAAIANPVKSLRTE